MDHLVLTVIAEDQPGLVERLSGCVAAHGGNWLESRMARMAGQFAGIVRVELPTEAHGGLIKDLEAMSAQGIRVQLAASGSEPGRRFNSIRLELVGNDRPGIVRDITRVLAEQGVNLESLLTEVTPAPMSGELLFTAEALLAVPETLALEQLQTRLEILADDLMVELNLRQEE